MSLHSAWAVVVAVAVRGGTPVLLARGRLELAGPGQPPQAYHAAADSGLGVREAAEFIQRWLAAAAACARPGLDTASAAARAAGHEPVACGIAGEERQLPPLAAILRSHPLLHAAEGQLARAAVADAAASLGLAALDVAAGAPGPGDAAILAALGRAAGPPWAADQKAAARAALAALRRAQAGAGSG